MSHTGGTFDTNYFDNAAAYGYSWRNDIWNGSYYASGQNNLTITTTDGTVYTGNTSAGNFVFTATVSGNPEVITIPWYDVPTGGPFTTSTAIFNVAAYFPGMTYSYNGSSPCVINGTSCPAGGAPAGAATRATQITQYLSSAIITGLIPGKVSSLTSAGLSPSVINTYYTTNNNLTPPGSTTGPWFDLYSLGMLFNYNLTGNAVYTYAYDDYLYAQGPFEVAPSQATTDNTTYVTVVLGPYSDN